MLEYLKRILPRRPTPRIGLEEASQVAMAFLEQVGDDDRVHSIKLGRDEQGQHVWQFTPRFRYGGNFFLHVDATYGFISYYAIQRR